MGRRWPESKKDEAIALYQRGWKYKAIHEETGVPQATVISWLHERGIKPSRLKQASGEVNVDQLLHRLAASERLVGELQAEVRRLKGELAATTDVTSVTEQGDGP